MTPRQVGFTGTRDGLSPEQITKLRMLLNRNYVTGEPDYNQFNHGSCWKGDDQAGWLAHLAGYWVVVHPPTDPKLRAYSYCDDIRPEYPYLVRDRHIVDRSHLMISCPNLMSGGVLRTRGSGTGYTTYYAIGRNRSGSIIWRDGQIETYADYAKRIAA